GYRRGNRDHLFPIVWEKEFDVGMQITDGFFCLPMFGNNRILLPQRIVNGNLSQKRNGCFVFNHFYPVDEGIPIATEIDKNTRYHQSHQYCQEEDHFFLWYL